MATLKYERLGGSSGAINNGNTTSTNSILNSSVNSEVESGSRVHYRVYKRRWFVMAVLCVLNISNAMVRFSPTPFVV